MAEIRKNKDSIGNGSGVMGKRANVSADGKVNEI
jgi:hypothetical protein